MNKRMRDHVLDAIDVAIGLPSRAPAFYFDQLSVAAQHELRLQAEEKAKKSAVVEREMLREWEKKLEADAVERTRIKRRHI